MTPTDLLFPLLIASGAVAFGVAAVRGKSERFQSLQASMRAMKPHEWVVVILFFGIVIFVIPGIRNDAARDMLRKQFHLPPDIAFVDFQRSRGYRSGGLAEGRVAFTEPQFDAYRSRLADPVAWGPFPLRWNGSPIIDGLNPDLQRWQDLPGPLKPGETWTHVLDKPLLYDLLGRVRVRSGKVLCFAIVDADGEGSTDGTRRSTDFRATSCADTPHAIAFVFGILDDDTRSLYMKVRHGGFVED